MVFVRIEAKNKLYMLLEIMPHGGAIGWCLGGEEVLGELGETPYEPFKEEQEEFMSGKDLVVEKYAHVLCNSLINFFRKKMFEL